MFENALETLMNAEAEFRTECGAWARSARIGEHQSAERKLSCAPSAAVHLSLLVWVIMYLVVVEPSWRYKVPGGVFSHLQFDIARGQASFRSICKGVCKVVCLCMRRALLCGDMQTTTSLRVRTCGDWRKHPIDVADVRCFAPRLELLAPLGISHITKTTRTAG